MASFNVDGLLMEYHDARSGGFELLRFVQKGKIVVLGLVSAKRGAIESKDDLKRRVDLASTYPWISFASVCNAVSHRRWKATH